MCSHDLHIGQYTQCPSLILFTDFPIPTKHAKMSANYSHFFFSLCFWRSWKSGQFRSDKDHTDGIFTVQDGNIKDRPSHVDNQLLVMWTYQRGQKVGQHSVSAGLFFIYFDSNRTLCTGPFPRRMASHFHSSLINRETNFGLNVSKTL